MNENISKKLRFILFAFVLIFMTGVSIFFSTENQRISTSSSYEYNDQWDVFINDSYLREISLPEKITAGANDTIKIQKTLNSDFNQTQVILLRGSLQNLMVLLDDQILFQKDFEDNAFGTYASLYYFVEIPANSEGKTIEIITSTPYVAMSGTINDIHYGSQSGLRDLLLAKHEFKLIVSISLIFASVVFILVSYFFFKDQQSYQVYIGVVGIFIGLWLFAESRIVQLYFNSDFLIGSMAYLSLATAPIAATAFLKYYVFSEEKKVSTYMCIVFSINLLTIIILHIFNILDFFESAGITISLISIGFIISLVLLVIEYFKTKKRLYRNLIIFLSAFSIFIFLEVLGFAVGDFTSTSNFASSGLLIILLVIFIINLYELAKKLKYSFKQEIYEEIAKTDHLTKAGSRFAFENEFENLFYNSAHEISLVYFDFDDLKYINDNFGHIEGDKTLILGYDTINKIFGKYGKCYRIGGDEFACLTSQLDVDLYEKLKSELENALSKISSDSPYTVKVSSGYTKLNLNIDKKPLDLIFRADRQMYIDKKQKKHK